MIQKAISVIFFIAIYASTLVLTGCKGEDSNETNNKPLKNANDTEKAFKFKNTLFSIPSPFLIVDLIKNTKVQYNPDLLNPIENNAKYSSNEKKALNLGVFTADMGYTNIYEQYSSTIKYIKVTKSISSDLQIMNSNSIDLISKIEDKIENTDSLNKIFANAYREVDFYLKDNDRGDASTLVLTGAWIEGLFLMTQTANKCNNELLINRIGEQKFSIINLLKIISQNSKNESKFHKEVVTEINELKALFDKIKIEYKYDKHIILPNEKKTIVLSETKISIPDNIMEEITIKTENIRNLIIK